MPYASPRPQLTRAATAILDDPERSDAIIARQAGVSRPSVWRARAQLVSMGLVAHIPATDRERRPDTQPAAARDAVAVLGPRASSREVADYASVTMHAAWKQLRLANHGLADAAAATDALSVSRMPRMLIDVAAAADQLSVSATTTCERCGTVFTFTPKPSRPARRWCGPDCRRPVRSPAARHPPAIPDLPEPPPFDKGLCTHVPPSQATWWTSSEPALREAARSICEVCPILLPCASWSLSLPAGDTAIYGAMTGIERQRLKRLARDAESPAAELPASADARPEPA